MNRKLIEDLHQYFEQKENRNGFENCILSELTGELSNFQIIALSRDDLKAIGFDAEETPDVDMITLASKMNDDYCTQLYWESLKSIAQECCDIPRHLCLNCGNGADEYNAESELLTCGSCNNEWKPTEPTDRYVKVEFPEDSSFFEKHDLGYSCFNSEDNGARYVPEHIYIGHFGKEPVVNSLYKPVQWPESQQYFELQEEDESLFELCEPIEHDKAFFDFEGQSIWVPLCIIK